MSIYHLEVTNEVQAAPGDLLIIDSENRTVTVARGLGAFHPRPQQPEQLALKSIEAAAPSFRAPAPDDMPAMPPPTRKPQRIVHHKRTNRKKEEDRQRVLDVVLKCNGEFKVTQIVDMIYPGERLPFSDHRACAVRDDLSLLNKKEMIERTSPPGGELRYRVAPKKETQQETLLKQ